MHQTTDFQVIICGGGPVGMGLAIELGQRGIQVAVVERYAEPQRVPKGQNLTQRTAEHFRAWNCEAEVRAAHPMPEGAETGGVTCYGSLLGDYSYAWLNRAAVKQYYAADNVRLPQYETEAVLRARVAQLPSVTVFYGWSGQAVAQTDDQVTLTIGEHKGDAARDISAAYLVGCDGSKSTVRDAAGITQTRSDHDRQMALVVFRSTEMHQLMERYPGKAFFNALHPDHDGYWQFFGRVNVGESWFFHAPVPVGTQADSFDFEGYIHEAVGAPFALDIDYVGFWDLRFAVADSYRAGRIFVAGDAAHSHPPYGGYGINIGLEDARNLGWKLASALSGAGGSALLDSYDAERRPVFETAAKHFIGAFVEADRAFLKDFDPARDLAAFEQAWSDRATGDPAVMSYEPNYEGCPIIAGPAGNDPSAVGTHSLRARAGHHIAPLPREDSATTFDLLASGFTLLAPANPSPQQNTTLAGFESAAVTCGLPLSIRPELTPDETRSYDAPLILVRPDHFVCWTGHTGDPEQVLRRAIGATSSGEARVW